MKTSNYTRSELLLMKYLSLNNVYFFSIKTIDKILNENKNIFDKEIKWKTLIRSLTKKWNFWNLLKWEYFFKIWINWITNLSSEQIIFEYLKRECKWKQINYYLWWPILVNKFWISEQIWVKYIIYNNILKWKRIINWVSYLFKTINKFYETDVVNWIQYASINQTIIDCINEPWYIWNDFQKLIDFFKWNKKYNIERINNLYILNKNTAWYKRFLYLTNLLWIKVDKDKKIYQSKNTIYLNKNLKWMILK